jgi:hypothetical protein
MPRGSDLFEGEPSRSLSPFYIEKSGSYYTISGHISAGIFVEKDPLI